MQKVQTKKQRDELLTILHRQTSIPNNWDTYDAATPTPQAVKGARHVIELCLIHNWYTPDIFPSPCGSVQFEWDNFGCSIELLIKNEKDIDIFFEGDALGLLVADEQTKTFKDILNTFSALQDS